MWRIFGRDKITLQIVEVAVASCFAELRAILREEKKNYAFINYTRIA